MDIATLVSLLRSARKQLAEQLKAQFARKVSYGDLITDRWENARELGFGEGSSCYDNVLVLGEVRAGKNVWVGPNVILDGSGGLEIGDFVSISAGVHIYTHHTVRWAQSQGEMPVDRAAVKIGSGVYIGPMAVIQKGVTIGDGAVVGAMSLVTRDIPAGARAWGVPAELRT